MNKKLLMLGIVFLVIALIFYYNDVSSIFSEITNFGAIIALFAFTFLSWGFGIPQMIIKFTRRLL